MAKATQPFHVWDPETGRTATFNEGDPVPDHIARTVGDHVVDSKPDGGDGGDVDTSQFSGEAFDAAVEARAAQLAEEKSAEAVNAYREREQAAYDAVTSTEEPFDPSADGVKAQDVHDYLAGLDRDTVAGRAEFDRVTQAERDGENRKTAFVDDE